MSTKSNDMSGARRNAPKLRHEAAPGMNLTDAALMLVFAANLILVPMALFAMGEERGAIASIKYLVVGCAAAGAAYGVNKFAVDRLAPLHAIGFKLAGALAVCGILLVGAGTGLGSLTGLLHKTVEVKTYQTAGQELSSFINATNDAALMTERLGASVQAVAENITQTKACEIQSACLSGGARGAGPMSRALEQAEVQGYSIAQALDGGLQERERLLDEINRLSDVYAATLAQPDAPIAQRRAELQSLHAEIAQNVSALREAMPLGVLESYIGDLQGGATIPGNANGSRALTGYLRSLGDSLAEQMDRLPEMTVETPEFPDRPGMIEVMKYLPAYLAIAAIVFVGELVLPITLYLMTYLRLFWKIEEQEGALQFAEKDDFDGLIKMPKDPKDGVSS